MVQETAVGKEKKKDLTIRSTRSIDQLFEQVKDYDLVLTTEASLTDALNSRLEQPVLGHFAITPRRLVYEEEGNSDFRQDVFLELVEEKDMSWRQASYLLRNVLDCWQYTGEVENILEYEKFDGAEKVIEVLEQLPNPFSAMEEYEIDEEKDVAVIGLHQFNELDRKVLPEEYDTIQLFTGEEHELPGFNVYESTGHLVQALKENVERVGPENTGIVMHPDGPYQSLVESVFEAEGIPFLTQTDLSEDNDLRTLVNLVRIGLSRENVRVKDVRPIIDELGFSVPRGNDNRHVSETEGLEEFKEFFNVLEYLDFNEVLRQYTELTGRDLGKVETLLEDLNLMEKPLSLDSLSDLEFFLESFELTQSETSEGVLFADPRKVSLVDRPVVFFIGMDSSWTRETGGKPWRDQRREEENSLKDFTSMIQSGGEQVYMVQDREMNQDITPCFHLNQVLDVGFSSFRDLPHTRYSPEEEMEAEGFKKEEVEAEPEKIEMLSQSRLNSLALSPRLYYFDQLVSDAEDEKLEKGNIFHDYAEFYINHPGFVEELGEEKVLEFMLEYVKPYVEDIGVEKLETELRIGLKNIHRFLERHEVEEKKYSDDVYGKTEGDNVFAEEFGKPIDSDVTEMWFEDPGLGAKGKIDLILNRTHLVDYKSGKKYDAKDIVEGSNPELYEEVDWPDFQAIMYLTYLRRHVPGEKLEFTFLNFLHNIDDMVDGEASMDDNTVTVTYYPETFDQKVSSLEAYEHLLKNSGKTGHQNKFLRKLGCQEFRQFFEKREISHPFSEEEILESDLAFELKEYGKEEVGDYKYVRKGSEQVLKSLVEFRRSNYFKEDLDRFEQFLEKKIEELNEYMEEGFPLNAKPDDLPKRDMMLE